MSGDVRRNAVRKYGRSQATGVFLGYICLMTFLSLAGVTRNSLTGILNESLWLCVFAIGGFASFLTPPTIVQRYAIRNRWLYCPQCLSFLASIRAVLKLNKESTCSSCGCEIEIAAINKRQARFDLLYIVGGLWALVGISWIILKVVIPLIPPPG